MHNKILCPFHNERTPSCVIYPDHYFCFGCRKYGPLSDLEGIVDLPEIKERKPEDLKKQMAYISRLEKKVVRGLELPVDETGYYIVWPGNRYYVKRYFEPRPGKYYRPAGHRPPLFTAKWKSYRLGYIVEGEMNALSVAEAVDSTVVSPGSATNFTKYLPYFKKFDKLVIVADRDNAGTLAAMELQNQLESEKKVILMERDANDWLVRYGRKGLKRRLEKFY